MNLLTSSTIATQLPTPLKDVLEIHFPSSFFLVRNLDAVLPLADSASVKVLFLGILPQRSSQPSLQASSVAISRGAATKTRRDQRRVAARIQTNAAKRAAQGRTRGDICRGEMTLEI